MKPFIYVWALGASISGFGLTESGLQAARLDPSLKSWVDSTEKKNQFSDERKTVIVYLKSGSYQDYSGLVKSEAIQQERSRTMDETQENLKSLKSLDTQTRASTERLWSSNALVMNVSKAQLRELRNQAFVDDIIENRIITLDKPLVDDKKKKNVHEAPITYGLELIHAPEAWAMGATGEGVTVGIIDSGIMHEHPDLKGKVVLEKDFTLDNTTEDKNGHGSHVAGTIAGGEASGVKIGVAPQAKLIIAKVFGEKGASDLATLLRAMEWMMDPDENPATDDAPRVVSNSWGNGGQWGINFTTIVKNWRRFQIFPNFAAGNSYFLMTVGEPARYPFSFAVAAVGPDSLVTFFSSRGPSPWMKKNDDPSTDLSWSERWFPVFLTKPDISAPGLDVYSSTPNLEKFKDTTGKLKDEPDVNYNYFSGTSMATPHITGVIALMLQVNPTMTIDQIESVLKQSTIDLGRSGKDYRYGEGLVQADRAVQLAKELKTTASSTFIDTNPAIWSGQTP